MKKLLGLALILIPSICFADRFGSIRSSTDVLLTTQAVSVAGVIHSTDSLQTGATFYVSSGTVAGQLSITGGGNGSIQLTIDGSTYTAISAAQSGYSVGQIAVLISTNGIVQGVPNSGVWASSVTMSTMSVLVNTGQTGNTGFNGTGGPGVLDVFAGSPYTANRSLFNVGSGAQANQFYVPNNHFPIATLGIQGGQLVMGDTGATGQRIYSNGDPNSYFDLRNGSSSTWNTGTANGPGDIRIQPGGTLMASLSTRTGISFGTITSTTTNTGNLNLRGGIYFSTWTVSGTGGTVSTTYQAGASDSVIFASAAAGAFTITLPPSGSDGQIISVYKADASTQPVTVRASGTELIDGTTQQFILNAIGHTGEVIAGAGGWWSHGIGIQPTPSAINALGKQNASVAIGVSSSVYTCVLDIPIPVAVTGFRYTGIAMASPAQIAFGLYDKSGNLIVSTGPIYGAGGIGTVSLGTSYVNLPRGQYYIGTQGSNTAISMIGSANAASNPFCEVTASTSMGMPATVTVVGGSATGRTFSTWLTVNGGRTTE